MTSTTTTSTTTTTTETVPGEAVAARRPALRQYAIEAAIGLALAALLVYVAWASSGEVPFVYQGY